MKEVVHYLSRTLQGVYELMSPPVQHIHNIFPLYEVVEVIFSPQEQEDVVVYEEVREKKRYQTPLRELLSREDLLADFASVDISLLRLLNWENEKKYHQEEFQEEPDEIDHYRLINQHFFSDRSQQEMLVLSAPNKAQQFCLSVRRLINEATLMSALRGANP